MEDKKVNVPMRRFEEFANAPEWEECNFSAVVDVRSGRDYKHLKDGDIPVFGTGGFLLSVSDSLSKNEDAVGIGRKGTIDNPYILRAPFWTVDTLFYAVPRKGMNLDFVFCLFQNVNWKSKDESTGVPSLSKTTINNVDTRVPSEKEQTKIGNFFATLDRTITLHQRKLEKTKALKSAYLAEMFPAEGECKPKRRFAGFTDDWERCRLGEVAEITSGGTPNREISDYWNGEIPWATTAEVNYSLIEHTAENITKTGLDNSSAKIMPIGTILMAMYGQGKTRGQVAILGIEAATNQANANIVVNNDVNNYFVYHQLVKNYLTTRASANEGGQANLSLGIVKDLHISFTKDLTEQFKIGTFFSTLDRIITSHQRKLEKLQNLKKAYLNEMFV